jgi:hypothetical protein
LVKATENVRDDWAGPEPLDLVELAYKLFKILETVEMESTTERYTA